MEAAKSKDVAEQTVLCLQALLEVCSCAPDEVLPFVERLSPFLDLQLDSVSEEVIGSASPNACCPSLDTSSCKTHFCLWLEGFLLGIGALSCRALYRHTII